MEEAAQFREDVACLVKETEKLLMDIKNERKIRLIAEEDAQHERHLRQVAEEDIKRLSNDLLSIEKMYP